MNAIRTLTSLAALVGVALIAGCDQGQRDTKSGAARADTTVAQQEQGRGNDSMPSRDKGIIEDAKRAAAQVADRVQDLVANTPEGQAQTPGKLGDATNDAAISAAVKSALAADPQVNALKLAVDTRAGVVTLTGRAPDSKVAERAVHVAATAKGVMRVENHLVVDGKS